MAIPYLACMSLVASLFGLPPRALPSIHAIEGGRPGVVHLNTDGSRDLGIMQVNTRWLDSLARYTSTSAALVEQRLLTEECYNIAAAGWILRAYLDEAHGDVMKAVQFYHSHTPKYAEPYGAAVLGAATRLFGGTAGR